MRIIGMALVKAISRMAAYHDFAVDVILVVVVGGMGTLSCSGRLDGEEGGDRLLGLLWAPPKRISASSTRRTVATGGGGEAVRGEPAKENGTEVEGG